MESRQRDGNGRTSCGDEDPSVSNSYGNRGQSHSAEHSQGVNRPRIVTMFFGHGVEFGTRSTEPPTTFTSGGDSGWRPRRQPYFSFSSAGFGSSSLGLTAAGAGGLKGLVHRLIVRWAWLAAGRAKGWW